MDLRPAEPTVIAICWLAIIAALVLGVGLATNLVLRHVVQTAPLWIGVILGFRHSRAASWAALPLFLVWLVLMALIWLYLLGLSNLISGHFAPVEIAMTIIVGAAAIVAIQLACLRMSFLPAIAHR